MSVKIFERLINRQKGTWIKKHCLRAFTSVNAPTDMIDQLGGCSLQNVGQGNGDGYETAQLGKILNTI